jgi:peptidoglycan hydrolase-like protein with peptidoglycan-binding domain
MNASDPKRLFPPYINADETPTHPAIPVLKIILFVLAYYGEEEFSPKYTDELREAIEAFQEFLGVNSDKSPEQNNLSFFIPPACHICSEKNLTISRYASNFFQATLTYIWAKNRTTYFALVPKCFGPETHEAFFELYKLDLRQIPLDIFTEQSYELFEGRLFPEYLDANDTHFGSAVALLQIILVILDFNTKAIEVDGEYGEQTKLGVEALQKDLKVGVNGNFDPPTQAAFYKKYGLCIADLSVENFDFGTEAAA